MAAVCSGSLEFPVCQQQRDVFRLHHSAGCESDRRFHRDVLGKGVTNCVTASASATIKSPPDVYKSTSASMSLELSSR
jgi:hypothetical protein